MDSSQGQPTTNMQCHKYMYFTVLRTCRQVTVPLRWIPLTAAGKSSEHHTVLYSWCFTLTTARCVSLVYLSVMEVTVSRAQVEESWHWTYSYPTSSWLMTHSRSQPSMSCGAERSLKGFSKWWSHAWGLVEDSTELQRWDRMDFQQCNAFCSANPKLHLQTVIYCQGQGSLLTGPLISWLMDLSTIGIYRCQHHFNVCMINSFINTENIPLSSYGGFVWAYVPIRPIMVRSNRAYSMGATECRQTVCLIPSMWSTHFSGNMG